MGPVALFIAKADIQYWVDSPGSFERTEKFVNEGLVLARNDGCSFVCRTPCWIFD
jgi:hypothetical protein